MCIAPVNVPDAGLVRCRKCWQCRKERVSDLVGRCIAESHSAEQTLAVTLTYAGDRPNAYTLVYRDVQNFLKSLRKTKGRTIRYIVTGEYGSKKGRAHWHIILFVSGVLIPEARSKGDRRPNEVYVAQQKYDRIEWSAWPHGFSYVQRPDHGAFAYALKYVLKDLDAEVQRTHLAMSKKPPLGFDFFANLARSHVEQGLAPQTLAYSFRDGFDRRGRRMQFKLRGRMAELYLDVFRCLWSITRGSLPPESDLLLEREDKLLRQQGDLTFDAEKWARFLSEKRYVPPPLSAEERIWEEERIGRETERYLIQPETGIVIDMKRNGSAVIAMEGSQPWHAKNLGEAKEILRNIAPHVSEPYREGLANALG